MKNQLCIKRLVKLARYLGHPYLRSCLLKTEKKFRAESKGTTMTYFYWAIKDFPTIFPIHWANDDSGIPFLKSKPGYNPLTNASLFFGLSMKEIGHLFVPGLQDPYLGRELINESTPNDLVNNIYELVLLKQEAPTELGIYPDRPRKCKIIKIKYEPLKTPKNAA